LVEKIARKLNAEKLINLSPNETKSKQVADISLLKNILKFQPIFNYDEGLKITMDWWAKK
jgi:nucleoside-diphosphate-sugar epimerase